MNGTKLKTLNKPENKSDWEKSGSSFRHYTYNCPNNFNPWDVFNYNALDNNTNIQYMNKKQRNAYVDAKKAQMTKQYFERSSGMK